MASAKPLTLGQLADRAKQLAAERSALAAQDKKLEGELKDLKVQIIEALDKQETRVAEGKIAKVSIVESEEPAVTNWDAFFAYVRKNNAFHLLQRRVSSPAWRELRALKKKDVPGTEVFLKRDLSIRAV